MRSQIAELSEANDLLRHQVDDHEKRIEVLEGPKAQMMQLIRTISEHEMQLLALNKTPEDFDKFKWVLSKEALFQATDESIETGLLTAVEIGSMPTLRSLTSIKLIFNNGRR